MSESQRIVSLLPSATEIVWALGLEDRLVAVTHECDYPNGVESKPRITRSAIDSEGMTAREIDEAVRESLADQATIYFLDDALLSDLAPDLILTQELCDVCAVGPDLVQEAVRGLDHPPLVVSLEPTTLDGVLESVLTVGRLAGVEDRAERVVAELRARLDRVRASVRGLPATRVLTMEWVDPLFAGGHWVPQMVELAGGIDVLGAGGEPSREFSWEAAVAADPDVVVAMPCGFGVERSLRELVDSNLPAAWARMRAVRDGQVYVVDGSSYFNRPGPRLVDGVEILAAILHADVWQEAPSDSYRRVRTPVRP